jgi:type VI secretion system secreted protein VgrG
VEGIQTAIVVGPSGEEIYTDEYGRVKVQFHWDRRGSSDENSSCWMRVSQLWAGTNWGAMFIPRIGQEVIVDFLEGDPDRPLVTGRVYHGTNMPPYSLPDEKTKSTIKSYSSPDGGGFNEIRFDDLKGEEQVFIHAEKNQDIRTEKDRMEWVGQDSHLIVVRNQLEKVEGDKHLTVNGDQNEKVDGTVSLEAGTDIQEKAGGKHALDAAQEIHLKAGMKVIIEAGTQVSLKAGSNFIDIGPSGVSIQGTMVNINSGGSAGSGSGSSPQAPEEPAEADTAEPGRATQGPPGPTEPATPTPQARALSSAAQTGTPFCET